jgi:hypothetical protein
MRYIRAEAAKLGLSPETKLSDFKKKYSDAHAGLLKSVSANAFGDVIPRFHTVGKGAVNPTIYGELDGGICVSADARIFLEQNHKALDLLAIGSWVRFTERFTSAPRLYEKIRGLPPKRGRLEPYRKFFLDTLGEEECFYCGSKLISQPHVDHVVPWSFVFEDQVWNLVLACDGCNSVSEKGSKTPEDRFIQKLIRRNETLLALPVSTLPNWMKTELSEWRNGGLEDHIKLLVSRCRADGFGEWTVS